MVGISVHAVVKYLPMEGLTFLNFVFSRVGLYARNLFNMPR